MAGPEGIEWRRSVPSVPLSRLAWYGFGAAIAVGLVWLLFGGEPRELDTGRSNPLAYALPVAIVLAVVAAVPFLVPVLRRPFVAANHYALTVRPGWWRTLVLPWAKVAGVATPDLEHYRPYLEVARR